MKILILAGGKGTRLWPISRRQKPKQFQRLLSDKTMLQETVERFSDKFSLSDIFVLTNREYTREVAKEFPKLPRKNIIAEPASRERIAAVALFLALIKTDDEEPIIILPSDHAVKKTKEFIEAILQGEKFIRKNSKYLLAFGGKATFPDTGLGYIQKGKLFKKINKTGLSVRQTGIYKVDFFKEKPNLKRARDYIETKKYFWNMGIYMFSSSLIKNLIREFVPDNYIRYEKIKAARKKPNFKKILEKEFLKMDNVSFDYSITENCKKVVFIPMDVGWSDVGSWSVLKNCLVSKNKNFIHGNHISVDSKNIMVYGTTNKLVATVGVRDLIIASTDDIILICQKDKSQEVKKIIKKLEKDGKFGYI